MTSFHVICGLGLPQTKILRTPINWRSPQKNFEDFFLRTLEPVSLSVSVLGLERFCLRKGCPWPRIFFVSLASSLVSSTPPLQIIAGTQKWAWYFLKVPRYRYLLKKNFGTDTIFEKYRGTGTRYSTLS